MIKNSWITGSLICLLLTGCGSVKSNVILHYHADRNLTITYSLSAKELVEVPAEVLETMRSQIRAGLSDRNLLATKDEDKFLKADILITEYRMRSNAARLLVGIMAGCDTIKSKVTIVDSSSEKTVGQSVFESNECAAWGVSAQVIEAHTKKVIDYLSGRQRNDDLPINLIPMYGYPKIEKSAALKKNDEDFIQTVVGNSGTRENASKKFAAEAWRLRSKGDGTNAMHRFNQSWLLNPNYYQPYWGFGAISLAQGKLVEAITYYEKALSLIDEDEEKARLLNDAANAYSIQGANIADKTKAEEFLEKANSLFSEALMLNPQYGNAYRNWAISLYREGNYNKAWAMVKKSRGLDGRDFSPGFIDALSIKMPEPE